MRECGSLDAALLDDLTREVYRSRFGFISHSQLLWSDLFCSTALHVFIHSLRRPPLANPRPRYRRSLGRGARRRPITVAAAQRHE
eukprot:6200396-Pleurochrysis_carterae.AAC.3